jgi:hypothetical protein
VLAAQRQSRKSTYEPRTSRRLDEEDPEPGYDGMLSETFQSPDGHFIGWTPGKAPLMEAPDMAWRLERGSDLVLQMHLLPAGAPVALQPQIGLFFTETAPTRVPFMVKFTSTAIDIPPGEKNYSVSDSYVLPVDVEALSVYPHAHYLGKELKGLARLPDGTMKWLIWIKNWDFSWQDVYRYRSPVVLPRGTTISMQYTYDNSIDNPHNANHPPRRVVYDPHSSDEMGDLWLQVVPRNPADARILTRDCVQRQVMAAIAGAEKMVAAAPNDAGRRNFLGADYLQAGRTEDAVAELDVAVRLRPDYGEAHNNLGSAFLSLGKLTEATRHFRQALRSRPHDDRVHFNLGNALKAAGQLDEAIPTSPPTIR